jgi:hypothetical protein
MGFRVKGLYLRLYKCWSWISSIASKKAAVLLETGSRVSLGQGTYRTWTVSGEM